MKMQSLVVAMVLAAVCAPAAWSYHWGGYGNYGNNNGYGSGSSFFRNLMGNNGYGNNYNNNNYNNGNYQNMWRNMSNRCHSHHHHRRFW